MLNHKLRAKGIGSSEIAMLLGISPWGGPHTLWRRKTRREESKSSPLMRRGQYIERSILDWYRDTVGEIEMVDTAVHPDYPWVVDSVDAIRPGICCVEAKTVHFSQHDKWDDSCEPHIVPLYYAIQCQWHCGVHGLPYCDVPVDTGTDFKLYRVDFDEAVFHKAAEIARGFWDEHVVADVEPPLDYDVETGRWLSANREQTNDTIRNATDDEVALMLRYRKLKISTKEMVALEVQLKEAIGGNEGIRVAGTDAIVTHRATKAGKRVLRSTKLVACEF